MYSGNKKVMIEEKELRDTYINEYGVEFLKHDGILYMRTGDYCDSFERVRTEYQIEKAFNPDRFAFNEWRGNYAK